MNTVFLLMAQFEKVAIPLEAVRKEFFGGMTDVAFKRCLSDGRIKLPVARASDSQKSERFVHVADLAAYIDERRDQALREIG